MSDRRQLRTWLRRRPRPRLLGLTRGQSMIEVLILVTGLMLVLGLSSGPLSGLVRAIAMNYSRFVEALSLP